MDPVFRTELKNAPQYTFACVTSDGMKTAADDIVDSHLAMVYQRKEKQFKLNAFACSTILFTKMVGHSKG
jgi:hypothetical protein